MQKQGRKEQKGNNWASRQAQSQTGSAQTRAARKARQSNPIQFHKFSPIP
jgi:hypothetical protein